MMNFSTRRRMPRLLLLPGFVASVFLVPGPASAESVVLPASYAANVNQFGIRAGEDITDKLNDLMKQTNCPAALFFPKGTYRVHDTLSYPLQSSDGAMRYAGVHLYGESEEGTTIELVSGSFTDVSHRKPIFRYEPPGSADYFGTRISRMTFLVDENNAGADGVHFFATNWGGMDYVTILSKDPDNRGVGLNPGYGGAVNGPFTIDRVTIDGFGVGIVTYGWTAGATFSHVTVTHQTGKGTVNGDGKEAEPSCGLFNGGNGVAVRKLHSVNSVPAVYNGGVMALLESSFEGGSADHAAIVNTGSTFIPEYVNAVMYVRDVTSSGYGRVLQDTSSFHKTVEGNRIDELALPKAYTTSFPNRTTALRLPIVDEPPVTIPPGDSWVDVMAMRKDSEGEDLSPALQRAIDSGASAIYVSKAYKMGSTVHVRGDVRYLRLSSLDDALGDLNTQGGPCFQFDGGTADTVLVEGITSGFNLGKSWMIQNNSSKQLVVRHGLGNLYRNGKGAGPTWMTDVGGYINLENPQWMWVTGLNSEGPGPQISNAGGFLSVVGFKNENGNLALETTAGGYSEVLGGLLYTTRAPSDTTPMMRTVDSYASLAGVEAIPGYDGGPVYKVLIEEVRKGETRVLKSSEGGEAWANSGKAVPLYTAFPPDVTVPAAPPITDGIPVDGGANDSHLASDGGGGSSAEGGRARPDDDAGQSVGESGVAGRNGGTGGNRGVGAMTGDSGTKEPRSDSAQVADSEDTGCACGTVARPRLRFAAWSWVPFAGMAARRLTRRRRARRVR